MSDLHSHVLQVATSIQDALDAHTFGTCAVPAVLVTAGQPAASIEACSQIAVWLQQVQDNGSQPSFGQTSGPDCISRRVAVIGVQIGICYSDPAENADIPADAMAAEAECLNDLVDVVFCGLADAMVAGTFGECAGVTVGSFITPPRQGGWVSSVGSITVDAVCDLTPGS